MYIIFYRISKKGFVLVYKISNMNEKKIVILMGQSGGSC